MNKEEREAKIYRIVVGVLMVGILSYGLILITIQNMNAKKRTDLPQTFASSQH